MNKTMPFAAAKSLKLPEEFRRGTKAYDLLAVAPLVVLCGIGVPGRLHSLHDQLTQLNFTSPNFVTAVAMLSNITNLVLTVLFVAMLLARRPAIAGNRGLLPRIAAIMGTYLAVGILQTPVRHLDPGLLVVSTAIEVAATTFAIYSLIWLGRSISMLPEARALVTGGPYSLVRHPLYLGEEAALIAVAMQYFSVWTVGIVLVQISCQIYRMNCEESVLAETFPEYSAYAARVSRLIPGIY